MTDSIKPGETVTVRVRRKRKPTPSRRKRKSGADAGSIAPGDAETTRYLRRPAGLIVEFFDLGRRESGDLDFEWPYAWPEGGESPNINARLFSAGGLEGAAPLAGDIAAMGLWVTLYHPDTYEAQHYRVTSKRLKIPGSGMRRGGASGLILEISNPWYYQNIWGRITREPQWNAPDIDPETFFLQASAKRLKVYLVPQLWSFVGRVRSTQYAQDDPQGDPHVSFDGQLHYFKIEARTRQRLSQGLLPVGLNNPTDFSVPNPFFFEEATLAPLKSALLSRPRFGRAYEVNYMFGSPPQRINVSPGAYSAEALAAEFFPGPHPNTLFFNPPPPYWAQVYGGHTPHQLHGAIDIDGEITYFWDISDESVPEDQVDESFGGIPATWNG